MPFLNEGQDQNQIQPGRVASGPQPPDAFVQRPATADTISAAFRQNNPISSVLDSLGRMPGGESDPNHNPLDVLSKDPQHAGDDLSLYAGSPNEATTRAIMARLDSQRQDERTLAQSGHMGTVAGLAAGLLDPFFAIPILGETAASAALGAGVSAAASETAMRGSQVGRTWQESAGNVASTAILGGVLGGAAHYLAPSEKAATEMALDEMRPRTVGSTAQLAPSQPLLPEAVGAAAVDTRNLEIKGALGVERLGVSPNLRIYTSDSVEAKRAMKDLAETALHFKGEGEEQVAPFGAPLESVARSQKNSLLAATNQIIEDNWFEHYYGAGEAPTGLKAMVAKEGGAPTTADKLSFKDFDQAVGTAMHNGDVHAIPEVQQAAQELRSKVFDPVKQMAQQTLDRNGNPMLAEELEAPKGAKSFFPLIPVRDALTANYDGARTLFANFLEREQTDKAAIQDRLRGLATEQDVEALKREVTNWRGSAAETFKATGDESALDSAVQKILASRQDLSRQELESRAQEWVDRLIGSPDGRLNYDAGQSRAGGGTTAGARDSLKERKMAIDVNQLIENGFVNTSATHGAGSLVRTVIPDVQLTRRFGDVDMTDTFRKINDEYAAKITDQTTPAQSQKIIKQRDSVIQDLAAARDRLRGTYGWDPSPQSRMYGGIIRDLHNVNALRSLGTSVANRLTDATNAVFRFGLQNVFSDAWAPFFQSLINPELRGVLKEQAKDAGVGMDGLLGHMRNNLYDVNNAYLPGNKFSRGLAWATDKSMLLNMHGPWTDWTKTMVFNVAQGEFGRVAARIADGTASKRDIGRMADASIDQAMATRIAQQYADHHVEVAGRKFANMADWTDRGAREAFSAAMTREANASVLTAGIGDKPLFMDNKLGSLMLQFHSFTAAAHEKILISNLQQRDGRALMGALTTIGMGMLGYRLYTLAAGQEVSTDPRDWIKEGLSRGALPGWFGEGNQLASQISGGKLDYNRLYGATAPLSRRRDLTLAGTFLGPTAELAERGLEASHHVVMGKASAADIHSARIALPLQNLMGFRILLDKVEASTAHAFGLAPRKQAVP